MFFKILDLTDDIFLTTLFNYIAILFIFFNYIIEILN